MIAMVQGTLVEKSEGEAILMTQAGVGLRLMCSMNTLAALPAAGQDCLLYTHMNVREDALELFGFLAKDEREMFRRLISISGIGPKSALFVLGSMPLNDLRLAILTGDVNMLTRAPGIGKKTAQRISLELKDKLTQDALSAGITAEELSYMDAEAPAQDALG
ncbi:MAG: Holliday junction branch migration protein RuvA, partial [Clostridia bacterium]